MKGCTTNLDGIPNGSILFLSTNVASPSLGEAVTQAGGGDGQAHCDLLRRHMEYR